MIDGNGFDAVDDLVDAEEIAHRLGLARPRVVHDWRLLGALAFPDPIQRRNRAFVWSWHDIDRWADLHSELLVRHRHA